jgi:hypothetical protein
VFGETDLVGADDVLDLWRRDAGLSGEVAESRIPELLVVATDPEGALAGVSTAYLRRNEQLGLDLWHYRAFVASAHRMNSIALQLAQGGVDLLQRRSLAPSSPSAAGVLMEFENEGVKRRFPGGYGPTMAFTLIGENRRGNPVRVRYFPGVLAPPPPWA